MWFIMCNVHLIPEITFSDLVKNTSTIYDDIKQGKNIITNVRLSYDSHGEYKFGAFKCATFGHLSPPVLGDSTFIVIKQCFFDCQTSGSKVIFDSVTQIKKLLSDFSFRNALCQKCSHNR